MCKRCMSSRQGYNSVHEVWSVIGRTYAAPLWVRVLWPELPTEYPRYLVEPGGHVVAIQEPGCACWHIRTAADDQDVKDTCPPVDGDFDECLEDLGMAFQFDTDDWDWYRPH